MPARTTARRKWPTATGTGAGIPTITQSVSDSASYFGLQVGGGVNLAIAQAVAVRLGVDALRVFHEGEGVNVFRFAAGIVVPFGRK